jgi:hypothetical protein
MSLSSRLKKLFNKKYFTPSSNRTVSQKEPTSKGAASIAVTKESKVVNVPAAKAADSSTAAPFQSLVERSIAAWNSLTYVGDSEGKELDYQLAADQLRSFSSLDDLFRSSNQYWFFQRRESFLSPAATGFLKWDASRLAAYVLLPAGEGFVNKVNCFFVSHFWRTKDHPDPKGEDYKLVKDDMVNQSWQYVWIDWACLPQAPLSETQIEYVNRMLKQASTLVRECGFEWRYPKFQPRLWVLVEIAQYMFTSVKYEVTPDMQPFVNDILKMQTEGAYIVLKDSRYTCSKRRDYRILVGWLEVLLIMVKLVPNVSLRRQLLNQMDSPSITNWKDYGTGIEVDKKNGIAFHGPTVYRFAPIWPLDLDAQALPTVLEDSIYVHPPAMVDKIIEIIQNPELTDAKAQLVEKEQRLGLYHADTITQLNRLADKFTELKQYREAEELRHRALSRLQKTPGSKHPQTLVAPNSDGAASHMQNLVEEASSSFGGVPLTQASPSAPSVTPLSASLAKIVEIEEAIAATDGLASAIDSILQADFNELSNLWGSEEILLLDKAAISELLYKVLQDNQTAGFRSRKVSTYEGDKQCPPFVQLNSMGNLTFRPYRIAKRQDGQLALYGHATLYRAKRALDHAKNSVFNPSAADLITKLIDIGQAEGGLLGPKASELEGRVRSIGSALNDAGGMNLMRQAHEIVRGRLGASCARELEVAWDGVGGWLG